MDSSSSPRTLGPWLMLPALAVPLLAWVGLPGCADPCVDDGLGQKYCPANETEAATGDETPGDGDPTGTEIGETEGCALLDVILIPQTPTLMLLVDQSGSMNEDFQGDTRWNVVTDVLIDPNDGIVAQFDDVIRFGLTLYTSVGGDMGGECPMLTEVDPAINNFPAIETTMGMAVPVQDTPTGESLDVTWQKLDALAVPGRKYIVLATDGEPDTCADPNGQGQPGSVAAAQAAYAAGIETFVISVGSDISVDHLQDMANAGQGIPLGDPNPADYYEADNEAGLVTAFNEILASVRSCQLDLMTPLTPDDAMNCTMEINGDAVGLDDPNGWQLNDSTEVELLGTACDALQQGTSSVQMTCSCDVG